MKKFFLTIIVLTLLLFTNGCTKEKVKITDNIKFKEEYEKLNDKKENNQVIRKVTISKDNPFIYKKASEIIEMMNQKKSFIVYFGYAKCPWCRSMIEELIKVAKDNNITEIMYVDIANIRDIKELSEDNIITSKEGTSSYYKLLEKLDSLLEDYTLTNDQGESISTNEKRIYAPSVVAIINGRPNKLESGISSLQTDPYQELTEDIKKDMEDKLGCVLKCLEENKTTCSNKC